ISQARGEREKPALKRDGVLSLVRHPWYLGGLLFLWSRRLTEGTVVTNAVLSVYLVAGAHLEERKLLRAFGAEYERYREEVPMLIPRAGDLASLLKRFTRSGR
ncbi:MAG: isoprenylcysteine carboxylmethyltransferase family protein, partial [Deltaproteobacteria bacterium]